MIRLRKHVKDLKSLNFIIRLNLHYARDITGEINGVAADVNYSFRGGPCYMIDDNWVTARPGGIQKDEVFG